MGTPPFLSFKKWAMKQHSLLALRYGIMLSPDSQLSRYPLAHTTSRKKSKLKKNALIKGKRSPRSQRRALASRQANIMVLFAPEVTSTLRAWYLEDELIDDDFASQQDNFLRGESYDIYAQNN